MSTIKPEIVKYFSQLIETNMGIQYNATNEHLLVKRLQDLAKILHFSDVETLWKEIQARGITAAEREVVLDLATNNETSFFRDPEIFEFIRNQFIPSISKTQSSVKIWCAATSTGQEPYSIAMLLQQMREQGFTKSYDLLATDFSERVLMRAREGIYSRLEVQRGLSPAMLGRFFDVLPGESPLQFQYKIKSDLARHMTFKRLNLVEPWGNLGPFDIIFCRNVLIYQDVENKKKIIARLADLLVPGGYLVLGGAESLLGLSTEFEMQIHGKACVYKLNPRSKLNAKAV